MRRGRSLLPSLPSMTVWGSGVVSAATALLMDTLTTRVRNLTVHLMDALMDALMDTLMGTLMDTLMDALMDTLMDTLTTKVRILTIHLKMAYMAIPVPVHSVGTPPLRAVAHTQCDA
jgi:hypothetical protein